VKHRSRADINRLSETQTVATPFASAEATRNRFGSELFFDIIGIEGVSRFAFTRQRIEADTLINPVAKRSNSLNELSSSSPAGGL